MKVYVVTLEREYEGSDVRGVYSTREQAQAWIDQQPKRKIRFKPYSMSDYEITEWVLDENWS